MNIVGQPILYFLGSSDVVSRIHFELLIVNMNEFHLKCLSKNGIFINHNFIKTSSTILLPLLNSGCGNTPAILSTTLSIFEDLNSRKAAFTML